MPVLPGLLAALGAGALAYTTGAHAAATAGLGVVRRGPSSRRVAALTFDDGPDPIYTPRVLEALAAAGARATFFLIGERAARYPQLARAIVAAGHAVGSHTQRHRHLWTLAPAATRAEMRLATEAIAAASGVAPRYFRPPWGTFNLAAYRYAATLGQVRVLWSLRPEGWRPAPSADALVERVARRLHAGAIIDLHDGVHSRIAPPAPPAAVDALPALLDLLRTRGYRCVTLDELLDPTRGDLVPRGLGGRLWEAYERAWARAYRLEPVGDEGVITAGLAPHRGPAVTLRDGTVVARGDVVAEVHYNRHFLRRLHLQVTDRRRAVALIRASEGALRDLAALVATDPRYRAVRALRATSLFWEGAQYLGFEIMPMESAQAQRVLGWYLRTLMARDHPQGRRRLEGRTLEPRILWMSREELLRRHRPSGAPAMG
ncbi:MAG: polysaccharide deacetylase family protein [Armatimonadota bacterium]|nr:polysaccharide deacetylase family protein [Armatimonadota bacterium]